LNKYRIGNTKREFQNPKQIRIWNANKNRIDREAETRKKERPAWRPDVPG